MIIPQPGLHKPNLPTIYSMPREALCLEQPDTYIPTKGIVQPKETGGGDMRHVHTIIPP